MRRNSVLFGAAGLLALALSSAWILVLRKPALTPFGESAAPPNRKPEAPTPWTAAELQALVATVESAAEEGLRPSDYKLSELNAAVDAKAVGPQIDALAQAATLDLAHDYAAGRIRNRHRFNWYIDYRGPDRAAMSRQIEGARAQGRLGSWLSNLLPTNPAYGALRTALSQVPADDEMRRVRLVANMERWRWLPRNFGKGDQLFVNLPTYQLVVMTDGRITDTFKAVIGATDMPTPVLSAPVRQVIANPDWIVPASIVRKSKLRPGSSSRYIFSTRPDGTLRVRQKPGPGNALGRVKIEFPNPLAIYFHDTPSKSLFGASTRAFSHGCVRVQNIEALATSIVAQPDRFEGALAGVKTRSFKTARPMQANIVYLTLTYGSDGRLSYLGDPYQMDEAVADALQGHKPLRQAPGNILPGKRPAPASVPRRPQIAPDDIIPPPSDRPSHDVTNEPTPDASNQT